MKWSRMRSFASTFVKVAGVVGVVFFLGVVFWEKSDPNNGLASAPPPPEPLLKTFLRGFDAYKDLPPSSPGRKMFEDSANQALATIAALEKEGKPESEWGSNMALRNHVKMAASA